MRYVYGAFCADTGELLYIGCTCVFEFRVNEHRSSGPISKWQKSGGSVVFGILHAAETPLLGLRMEAELIVKLRPLLNVQSNRKNPRSRYLPKKKIGRKPYGKRIPRDMSLYQINTNIK